jgi:membrane-associated phospholipid phosphatase
MLKTHYPVTRPNLLARSFPSGHTAAAFLGAGFTARRHSLSNPFHLLLWPFLSAIVVFNAKLIGPQM